MVIFEHRSGAYMKYVSTEAQKRAICRLERRASNWTRKGRSNTLILLHRAFENRFRFSKARCRTLTGIKTGSKVPAGL